MESILILVPHWESPIALGIVNALKEKVKIITLDFNEKDDLSISESKFIFSKVAVSRIPYSSDRYFSEQESLILLNQINKISKENNVSYIFSCKNRYERFLSEDKSRLGTAVSVPSLEIMEIFQDKRKTINKLNELEIPVAQEVGIKFLNIRVGAGYIKPRRESNTKKSKANGLINSNENDFLLLEKLQYPEINHTVFVKEGEIQGSWMYSILEKMKGIPSRKIVQKDDIAHISNELVTKLSDLYGVENTDGIYNIDYMVKAQTDEFIISEVNPGRLPAGHSVFLENGYSLPEIVLKTFCGI